MTIIKTLDKKDWIICSLMFLLFVSIGTLLAYKNRLDLDEKIIEYNSYETIFKTNK